MRRWDSMVNKYEQVLKAQGLVKNTILNRISETVKLGIWLKKRRPLPVIEDFKEEHFTSYLKVRTKFKSKSTTQSIMSHLRCLGDYLVKEKMLIRNPMIWLHGPRVSSRSKTPKRISQEDMLKLWVGASKNLNNHNQHVLMVLLSVLYGTGLRRGELERLCINDFLEEEKCLILDGRKSKKERKIALPPDVYSFITAYLPFRQNALIKIDNTKEKHLFVSARGVPLKAENISTRIHSLAKRSGISPINLHHFRHTCASDLLSAGFRIDQVQEVLGHANISTTMRYCHIASPERKEAMQRHPINDLLSIKILEHHNGKEAE